MEIAKAIEILEKGQFIGVLVPPEPSTDMLSAAEALLRALQKRNKAVGLLEGVRVGRGSTRARFSAIASAPALPKEFIISLDTTRSPASELRYEKENDRIDIIFSPKSGAIREEHVSFRSGKLQCDLILAIGIEDLESSGAVVSDPDIFTRAPIINIDSKETNKRFGEVNIVGTRPNSEAVYSLLTALEKMPPEEPEATILLAGILSATDKLSRPDTRPETVLAASELMRAGANFHDALSLAREPKAISLLQLIGRASVRSKLEHEGRVLWSFLTPEDFEKTGRAESDTPSVLSALTKEFPWESFVVLLTQGSSAARIRAYIAGPQEALGPILEESGGEWASDALIIPTSFENFKDAEDHVRSLLGYAL